jgi:hypothetical protein
MMRIPETRTKYGSKKTKVDEITFDSHLEALRYIELKRLKQAGIVKDFECQPAFELQPAYRKCCNHIRGEIRRRKDLICPLCGKKMLVTKAISYRADFRITYEDGRVDIEDVKGAETALFKLKRKMFEYRFPELTLTLVKGVHR